ncbi:MAG: sugar transferase [Chloroflexi bacterium]|nr:sugar transferase [Chloroflexota bacterium]
MSRQLSLRFTLFLLFFDLFLVGLALLLAERMRIVLPLGKSSDPITWTVPLPVYLMGIVVWAVIFATLNVYRPRQIMRLINELFGITEATVLAWLVLAGLLYFTYRELSRLQYLYFLMFYLLLIYTHRSAVRAWFWLRGGYRYHVRRVLIVGSGEIACDIGKRVKTQQWMGLELAGFVSENNGGILSDVSSNDLPAPVLGTQQEIPELIQRHTVSEVVIALSRQESHQLQDFVHQLQSLPVNIRLIPDYFDMAFLRVNIEDFSGVPLLSLKEPVLDPFQRLVKRVFDLTVTSLLLIPALPLMGIMALIIRRDSAGPALFRQARLGEGGRTFTMLKFRTMHVGAEALQQDVMKFDENGQLIYKQAEDPRVTGAGRWLRRTSLDELPQLFNILRGEMSLVGPRPEMPWLVEKYEPWQRKRFEVPQGLTGWWQVTGRADKPMYLNTEDDLFYIRNYSIWLDLRILWLTLQTVLLRRGAY